MLKVSNYSVSDLTLSAFPAGAGISTISVQLGPVMVDGCYRWLAVKLEQVRTKVAEYPLLIRQKSRP